MNDRISLWGIVRDAGRITLEFNKMLIPVAIGGIAVAGPYTLFMFWLTAQLKMYLGPLGTTIALFAFLCVTTPVLAMLMIAVVFTLDKAVPWDGVVRGPAKKL